MTLGFITSPLAGRTALPPRKSICTRPARHPVASRPRWTAVAEPAEAEATTSEWVSAAEISAAAGEFPTVMSIEEIMKVLPHRYPFLLVDRVVAFEPGKRAIGIKNISMNEPQFTGHFPGRPIMPGVLQVEALAQVGGIVMLQQPFSDGKGDFFFGGVDRVKWRKPVLPGDTLVMEMEVDSYKPGFGVAKMVGK